MVLTISDLGKSFVDGHGQIFTITKIKTQQSGYCEVCDGDRLTLMATSMVVQKLKEQDRY